MANDLAQRRQSRAHGSIRVLMSALTDRHQPPPQAWTDTLARARADVAAGRVHDLEDVLCDLDRDSAEIEDEVHPHGKLADEDEQGQARGPRMGR